MTVSAERVAADVLADYRAAIGSVPGDAGGWPALTGGKRRSKAGIPPGETIYRLS